jgi:LPXTG-motif cell wall-anchored protein
VLSSLPPDSGHPGRSDRFRRFSALAAVLVALAVILAACDNGGSDSSAKKSNNNKKPTTTTSASGAERAAFEPEGPEAAIAEYLKGQGIQYVGDCADAKLPRDKGKWCSTLVSGDETSDTQTYDLGPVGEKPEKTITLKRKGDARLTPGFQVSVAGGDVGTPSELTREQLQNDLFITGNLLLDQAAGIGNGLADLPAGSNGGTVGNGGGGTGGGGTGGTGETPPPPIVENPGGGSAQYPPQGTIVVENPVVEAGGQVAFNGGGCLPNEPLAVLFDGHPIGTISADASGNFAGSLSIPKGTAPGAHLLTVRGSDCILNATITVRGNLAFTGSSSHTTTYVLAGVAAVVVGLVLVVGSRRRRHGVRGRRAPPAGTA